MSNQISLNQDWLVRCEPLDWDAGHSGAVLARTEDWLPVDVPCDIRQPLLAAGLITEPLEALNCFESEWIEDRSWWFLKHFCLSDTFLDGDRIELVLESVDYGADIWVNGRHAGFQLSSFYPFRKDVKSLLHPGDNTLLVRLTTGLERVSEADMAPYNMSSEEDRRPGRGDRRKGFLRKPQYAFGWDWNPRVATCGIMKDVRLESHNQIAIRHLHVATKAIQPAASLSIDIEADQFHPFATCEAMLQLSVTQKDQTVWQESYSLLLRSGLNPLTFSLELPDAQLWWPNGMGSQPLYQAIVTITTRQGATASMCRTFGIRTVALDQTSIHDDERLFAITINGHRVFCKGGNWIPADSLYGRVTDERYKTLVAEAREAGFNMLRIWGGGLYERDIFYETCDASGIMIWHDFMFACSEHPDDLPWYRQAVDMELDYQTRHLGSHPSIVLWSGNNENHWGFASWWPKTGYFGATIYNYLAPAAVARNCPETPYWNSSPYGGPEPNSSAVGDRHHWHDCMMNPDINRRIVPEEYDKVTAKFISEYGYIGPMKRSSIERYFAGNPVAVASDIWHHHTNTFEADTVAAGIALHYADPDQLGLDDYLLYAGLVQGLMYSYSLEAFRSRPNCWGGLFWMYNDCWGETGWTIIDYYLTRKISYSWVRRAFAPVKLIMRADGDRIKVTGINDSPDPLSFMALYGYSRYDGSSRSVREARIHLPAFSRQTVLSFERETGKDSDGVWFIQPDLPLEARPAADKAILRTGSMRQANLAPAEPQIIGGDWQGSRYALTVTCDRFAHAVHFNLPDQARLSDDYFDLLPGEQRVVIIENAEEIGLDPATLKAIAVMPQQSQ